MKMRDVKQSEDAVKLGAAPKHAVPTPTEAGVTGIEQDTAQNSRRARVAAEIAKAIRGARGRAYVTLSYRDWSLSWRESGHPGDAPVAISEIEEIVEPAGWRVVTSAEIPGLGRSQAALVPAERG